MIANVTTFSFYPSNGLNEISQLYHETLFQGQPPQINPAHPEVENKGKHCKVKTDQPMISQTIEMVEQETRHL